MRYTYKVRFSNSFLKQFIVTLLVAGVYIIVAKIGLTLAFVQSNATAFWPPTGLAIAALLLLGYRYWPAIMLGAFIANLTTAGTIFTSLGIAAGNTLEALIAAYLVNRFADGVYAFKRAISVVKFALLAGVLSTTISATVGLLTLVAGGLAAPGNYGQIWLTWWLGDLGGAIAIAPLIILWLNPFYATTWNKKRIAEVWVIFALLWIAGIAIFTGLLSFPYILMPLLIWPALRFGPRETVSAVVILTGIAVWSTIQSVGPFMQNVNNLNTSLILLQAFMATVSVTILTLAAAVSERRENEARLAASEGRFRSLIEHSSDAIALVHSDGGVAYASPSTKRILNYPPYEFVGMNGFSIVYPEDLPRARELFSQMLKQPRQPISFETRVLRKGGEVIWISTTGTNLLDEPGINAIVINYHNITARKKIELLLAAYNKRILQEKISDEAILASIGDGLIVTDQVGRVTLMNPQAEIMFGWNLEDAAGKFVADIIPIEDEHGKPVPKEHRPITLALMQGKKVSTFGVATYYYVHKNGKRIPVALTATPILTEGVTTGAIDLVKDVTTEQEVDRAKSDFISIAAHQLRTPLSSMKWILELLLESKLTKPQKQKVELLDSSNERLINIVRDLLNITRIESGKMPVKPEMLNINDVVEATIKLCAPQAKEKNVRCAYQPMTPAGTITTDQLLLTEAIKNILDNAISFAPRGTSVRIASEQKADGFVISVANDGPPISEVDRPNLFKKFYRGIEAPRIKPSGSGLGLYVTLLNLEALGGSVWFDSPTSGDHGVRFYLQLPQPSTTPKRTLY